MLRFQSYIYDWMWKDRSRKHSFNVRMKMDHLIPILHNEIEGNSFSICKGRKSLSIHDPDGRQNGLDGLVTVSAIMS